MISIHYEVSKEIYSTANDHEQASIYISDKSKLEVAKSIVQHVYWGEGDWFFDE